jgi:predicted hotdog family 3-hydroxylacyl-ACP dehydratase
VHRAAARVTDISDLLPHKGTARMLDRVVAWDAESITAASTTHHSRDNPLRREGRLASVHLIEYGAQAMALHGALRDRAAGRDSPPALLVSVRNFHATRDFLDDLPEELLLRARALLIAASSWQYEFEARHAGALVASGRVAAIARRAGPGAAAPQAAG